MPLQKLPPSRVLLTDKRSTTERQALRDRRKTLQTINELSPQSTALSERNSTFFKEENNTAIPGAIGNSNAKRTKSGRRKSLPVPGNRPEHDTTSKPSILVTPAEAAVVHRFQKDPIGWHPFARSQPRDGPKSSGSNKTKRVSINSPKGDGRSQDPPLSPVAEGALLDPNGSIHAASPQRPNPYRMHSQTKQPTAPGNGKSSQEGGWNARREKERLQRQQAIEEAKSRRAREGHGIIVGTSSNLPSMSPLPTMRKSIADLQGHLNQQPMLQNGWKSERNGANQPLDRRASYNQMGQHTNGVQAYEQTSKRASTGGHVHVTPRDSFRRSRSEGSDPSWALHSNPTSAAIPQLVRSSSSGTYSIPITNQRYLPNQNQSSSSPAHSPHSTCASSIKSTVSDKSNRTQMSHRSIPYAGYIPDMPTAQSKHYSFDGNTGPFPTLMRKKPQPNVPLRSTSLIVAGPQQSLQAEQLKRSSQISLASTHQSSNRQRSRSRTRNRASASQVGINSKIDSVIQAENPDKTPSLQTSESARLAKEREKLAQWKAEREKRESEKQAREKIKERVRRANELEAEKEKELIKETKKKNRKSFLCGIFKI